MFNDMSRFLNNMAVFKQKCKNRYRNNWENESQKRFLGDL